jgi:hypothetical protein
MWKLIKNSEWKELYNEVIHNLYPSTYIISEETKEDNMERTCSTHADDERRRYFGRGKLENK